MSGARGALRALVVDLQGSPRILDRVVRVVEPVGHVNFAHVEGKEAERDAALARRPEELDGVEHLPEASVDSA